MAEGPRGGRGNSWRSLAWVPDHQLRSGTAIRFGWIFIAVLVWDLVVALASSPQIGQTAPLIVLTVAVFPFLAVLLTLILRQPMPAWSLRWPVGRLLSPAKLLILASAVVLLAQLPSLVGSSAAATTDVTPTAICAARNLLHRQNPYRTPELLCLHQLGVSPSNSTPLRAGPFAHLSQAPSAATVDRLSRRLAASGYRTRAFPTFGYPPLSLLLMLPVAQLGFAWWTLWTVLAAVIWLVVIGRLSGRWWPQVLCLVMLQLGIGSALGAALQGDVEFFCYALMALSLFIIDAPGRSGIALGLAMATNPLAWVTLPAYLLLSSRLPHFGRRALFLGGTLLVAVGPWLLIYPNALSGMLGLITQPVFPLGIGLVALSLTVKLIPLAPKLALTAAFLAGEVGLLGLGLWRKGYLPAAVVATCAIFWVSWRSDANYLVQLPLLACAMAVGLERLRCSPEHAQDAEARQAAG